MKAQAKFDHTFLAVEEEHDVHCMLEIEVPEPDSEARVPLHIALVLDRSGSMAGTRLDAAKRCAKFLAERLHPEDQFALIAYDNDVELVHPLAPVVREHVLDAIDRVVPGGMTNLSGGWLKGIEEAQRASDGVRRVLLLTDGRANVGMTDRKRLRVMALASKSLASTTTIGFGEDFDEDLLAMIADAAGGATYFAESPEDAPGIFAEEFDGLTSLVAQNVSVEIRPGNDVELLGVLNDYPVVEVPGGLQLQIGDAYGGERRRVVFRLHIPSLAALGPASVAHVVLRYVTVGDEVASHEVTIPVVVNLVSADEAAAAELDQTVVEEVVLLEASQARRDAARHADAGNYDAAEKALLDAAGRIERAMPNSGRLDELFSEVESLHAHSRTMKDATYGPVDRKRMMNESWRRNRGRGSGSR